MPLLFGTVFISLLFFELSEANRLMQRELLLKDMMITYLDTTKCRIFSERLANMYKATHDQFYKVEYQMFKRKNEDAHKHLTRLLKKVPSLQNEFFLAYSSNLGQNRTQLPFLQRLQGLWERQNKAAHQAMDQLRTLLYVGMFSGILLSALLALFFSKQF